jgi:hypothetical protein
LEESQRQDAHAEVTEPDAEHASEEVSEDHAEEEHVDYSNHSRQELLHVIKELVKENNFRRIDHVLREVKPVYDELRDKERAAALERFTQTSPSTQRTGC